MVWNAQASDNIKQCSKFSFGSGNFDALVEVFLSPGNKTFPKKCARRDGTWPYMPTYCPRYIPGSNECEIKTGGYHTWDRSSDTTLFVLACCVPRWNG